MLDSKWESVINSKILANYFKEICGNFLPPYRESNSWMNRRKAESNANMISFLTELDRLIKEEKVDANTFINEIKKITKLNILQVEILWYLEFFRLMTLSEFIEFHENNSNREIIEHIARQIFETILDYKTNRSEIRKKILSCFLKTILECSGQHLKRENIFYKVELKFIIENLKEFYACGENYECERNFEISHVCELFGDLELSSDLMKLFFQHILRELLEGSQQTMKSIIRKQENEKNIVKDKKICHFFKAMSNYCDVNFMIDQMQTKLFDTVKDLNWDHMFCFVTFVGMNFNDGWSKIKTLINLIIKNAFEFLNKQLMFHAFLLARQGCFENCNNFFPNYLNWFSSTFSSESKRPINSKEVCSFFFNFLTEIIPYDSTYYLKVHINKVPWVPSDCLSILHQYVELVKIQLSDLNTSLELGICENTTNKSAAVYDVEHVLKHFERTSDILNSVFQASMFWKDYYEKKFLAELLSKFEGKKSVRHKFIIKLHSLGKIPNSMFKVYRTLETKKNKNL